MNTTPVKEILTATEVMQLLDVCRATITRMKSRGDLPYYKFCNRLYFKRSEVLEALERSRVHRQPKAIPHAES